jgi:RNA polymerase sigma-70 factor (ECF subfamily)
MESAELAQAIQDCLDRLQPDSRILAVLVDVQGHNYQEAAAVIGKPIGTVKSRLSRARAKLRDCLQGYRELLPSAFRLEDK